MTYQINNTAGDLIATIADGTSNTSTSLTLVGRKYSGYGEILQENLVKLLENFAHVSAPSNPVPGQIWYDTAEQAIKHYQSDSTWQTFANVAQLAANVETLTTNFNSNLAAAINSTNANAAITNQNIVGANAAISSLDTLKATKLNPTFTGVASAATADHLTSTTQLATTQFVRNELGYYSDSSQLAANVAALIQRFDANISSNVNAINASVASTNSNVAAANVAIASLQASKAPLESPALTGTPVAPTADITVATTQLATTEFVHNILPAGIIMQWYGNTATIPSAWALCDGQTVNGYVTPNLTDRFVVSAGSTYPAGTTGGSATVTATMQTAGNHTHGSATGQTTLTSSHIPAHNHSVTVTGAAASHSHNFTDVYAIVGDEGLGTSTASTRDRNGNYIYPSSYVGNGTDYDYDNGAYGFPSKTDAASPAITLTVSESSYGDGNAHSHTISSDTGHTHIMNSADIIPPYYALCYIMKVV